jgi:hypothetical protein
MQGNFPEDVSLQKTIMLLRDLENSIYRLKKTNASVLDFMNTISSNKKYFLAQLIMAVLSQQILVGNEKFLAALQKTIQLQVRACLNQNVSLEEFKNTMQIP